MGCGWHNDNGDAMSETASPKDLASTFIVLKPDHLSETIAVSETVFAELDERFSGFAGHTLVSSFSFEDDWPTWEMHPKGDEIVCLMSGDVEMVLASDNGEQRTRLKKPGSFVVVPKGTWHTARVFAPTTMFFVTPGEGTENSESPDV